MSLLQESFEFAATSEVRPRTDLPLMDQLRLFKEFGKATEVIDTISSTFSGEQVNVPTYVNEFWTSKQCAANSLHEVSYRACFKPQLPRFFIQRLTVPGELVFDPFMGRGTTVLEAALMNRVPSGCDINPLSAILTQPRLRPPTLEQIAQRLEQIDFTTVCHAPEELFVFQPSKNLKENCALREYLTGRQAAGTADPTDEWIRMVAVNRLTGHSQGFFSVYTLPPNQAVSIKSQKKINQTR